MTIHTSLADLNAADRDAFVAAIGHAFERSPWVAAEAWDRRPFATVDGLHAAMIASMWAAPASRKLALIEAHPDLAGKAAIAGDLTADSANEQASAGLDRLSAEEFATFTRLNSAYRERFGFPFIICVREQSTGSILAPFERRLAHDREAEMETALTEIAKIAWLRLADMLSAQPPCRT